MTRRIELNINIPSMIKTLAKIHAVRYYNPTAHTSRVECFEQLHKFRWMIRFYTNSPAATAINSCPEKLANQAATVIAHHLKHKSRIQRNGTKIQQ